jgi:virulence-associated protein VapD
MYAIAFDLIVSDTARHHPLGVAQAYSEIASTLQGFGFERVQGSLYVCDIEDMANLFLATQALKAQPWFPRSVRAFRVRQ